MSGSRTTTLRYAAAWLFVVSAIAGLTWAAIGRAGAQASLMGAAPPLGAAPPATAPPTTASPAAASPNASAPGTSATAATAATATTASLTTSEPAASDPPRSAWRSFVTAGGTVLAYCLGSTAHTRVVATEGWRFEVGTEDGTVEVKLEPPNPPGDDIEVNDIEVTVRCVAGAPIFGAE